ncbi:MAG TPA: patatin-like phospholipase family protein [Stellaceae bacterium]|nr:patatin-like phospholipase family protein [Stellaceae bacterium]
MTDRATLGIALGSGGARGWAHIGVLAALAEAKLAPDIVCGTSIGAVIGAIHLTGQLGEFTKYVRRLTRLRVSQFFDFKLGAGGMIAGNRVLKVLQPILRDTRIEALPRRFGCVATDVATGEEVWLREGRLIDALAASYAIPGLFPSVPIGGRWLFDGALTNPVPASLTRALGAEIVVAVDVNAGILAPLTFESDQVSLPGRRSIAGGLIRRMLERRKGGPSAFGAMSRSLQIMQTRMSRIRLAEDPPALVLRPEVGRVGPLEFYRADECIEAGAAAVRASLPALREAVAQRAFDLGAHLAKKPGD